MTEEEKVLRGLSVLKELAEAAGHHMSAFATVSAAMNAVAPSEETGLDAPNSVFLELADLLDAASAHSRRAAGSLREIVAQKIVMAGG